MNILYATSGVELALLTREKHSKKTFKALSNSWYNTFLDIYRKNANLILILVYGTYLKQKPKFQAF
jgi:hypothetical protein